MANEIALTTAKVSRAWAGVGEVVVDGIALETLTIGQALYQDPTTGRFGVADANAGGKQQFRGITLKAAYAGQSIPILVKGFVEGFTISGMSYDDPAYLSDTAGYLSTAVGTMTVICGRVVASPDLQSGSLRKLLYIDADWNRIWA
jgi:hypothetical protein